LARSELHSETLPKIEQQPDIVDPAKYDGDIILTDKEQMNADYAAELAFMAEPVTIRLEPSSDKNAATVFPIWVNGRKAEVFQNGGWQEIGYLPVGVVMTVRRYVLEVIIRAKVDTVQTRILDENGERPNNVITRFTSPIHSFSIISDPNPRGPSWVAELRRRNL
jgi:hypothetical protein